MEIQSPIILKSSFSRSSSLSLKHSQNHSLFRYNPAQFQEERSITLLDLFKDSLEESHPKSDLIDFPESFQPNLLNFSESKRQKTRSHSRKPSLSISKPSSISEMLINLQEKPKPKSSIKHQVNIKKHKTVSFCSQIELSSPDTVMDSMVFVGKKIFEDSLELKPDKSALAIATNSIIQDASSLRIERNSDTTVSTQQNADYIDCSSSGFESSKKFVFEEDIRSHMTVREAEFNEFSTVAYCVKCEKETVTQVGFEKIKGQSCIDITEWIVCWIMPACMYRKKMLVHCCSFCKSEIFKAEV